MVSISLPYQFVLQSLLQEYTIIGLRSTWIDFPRVEAIQ